MAAASAERPAISPVVGIPRTPRALISVIMIIAMWALLARNRTSETSNLDFSRDFWMRSFV